MIKIVIQGASGLKNSGDEAILQAILQNIDSGYEITVTSFQVAYSEKIHSGVHFVKMGSRECIKAVKNCDIFILGGGGLIQDETSIYNVMRWMKYLKYCIKKGKKTYLYANSIGPVRYQINRKQVQKWLKKVDVITVRDNISRTLLKNMGIYKNVELTADPVFRLQIDPKTDIRRFQLPERYAVICVRHWYDTNPLIPVSICTKLHLRNKSNTKKYQEYINRIAELTEYLKTKYDLEIVFLPFLQGRDNKVARDIIEQVKSGGQIVIEDEYIKPEEAVKIIRNSQYLIGMRLHSIIYAAISKVPVLILSYSSKVKGMAEYLHMEDFTVDVDDMNIERMKRMINRITEDRDNIQIELNEKVQLLKEKEIRNSEVIREIRKAL